MPVNRNGLAFCVSAGVCIFLSLLLLTLPLQWILAAIIAAAFHEACHALAVSLCGGTVSDIRIRKSGALMLAKSLTPGKELLCTLAGPAGGLFLLLFVRWIPRIAFCAAVHSAYNLLPLSHLDGGKVLHNLLRMLFPGKAERISFVVQNLCLVLLWILAVYLTVFLRLGLMPLLFMVTLTQAAKKDLANIA